MRQISTSVLLLMLLAGTLLATSAAAWEPTKPIEFVVPAGTGGGADQMARLIHGIAEKHKLSPRPIIVVNKSGGRSEEHTSELQSHSDLVCRLLLEKKKQ